jgi:hypothetical protein
MSRIRRLWPSEVLTNCRSSIQKERRVSLVRKGLGHSDSFTVWSWMRVACLGDLAVDQSPMELWSHLLDVRALIACSLARSLGSFSYGRIPIRRRVKVHSLVFVCSTVVVVPIVKIPTDVSITPFRPFGRHFYPARGNPLPFLWRISSLGSFSTTDQLHCDLWTDVAHCLHYADSWCHLLILRDSLPLW